MMAARRTQPMTVTVENFHSAIRWHVGNLHVGTADATIAQETRDAGAKAARTHTNWLPVATLTEDCVAYALQCHHENQQEYREVVGMVG